ncbi:universal stress protein [Sediminibacterium roseum]|uniref:Universal stress protein n=1 Tax=Sediminibacterium roseum TaxID=1978412 RepID=A0ABX0A4C9_9BACT|nr:universal stress protein [Sediminibacterium roseum]NCI52055.1 universal stress protein [Sediminibacterium roseum]
MKKIIAAIDGLKYAPSTTAWATRLGQLCNSHLAGIFLEDEMYTSYNVYELLVKKDVPEKKLQQYKQQDQKKRDESVRLFSTACDHARLHYNVHRDHNPALQELLHETIFADLLVIDKHETLTHYTEPTPTRFIRDLLADAHCPVLLVSDTFHTPDKIIVLYDGHPSSVHALKMFSYLLAPFVSLPVEIISFRGYDDSLHLPDTKLMKELVKKHFNKASFTVFKGNYEENIASYFAQQKGHPLVVTGAYGRGMLSRWFRASTADVLMKENKFPIFITHSK